MLDITPEVNGTPNEATDNADHPTDFASEMTGRPNQAAYDADRPGRWGVVDMVRPSRDRSRTRNIIAGVAGVTALTLMAEHHTRAGLLALSALMVPSVESGQFPGQLPRRYPDVSQLDGGPTTTLDVAPETFTSH